LLGETITSKLISKAGSLERLVKMPSSTIQLLGAENAFFRFLKSGGRNPKHGYIYNHPFVLRAKRKNQGKAARILANKISICAKVDFFNKRLIDHTDEYSDERVNEYSDEHIDESIDKSISDQNVSKQKINMPKTLASKTPSLKKLSYTTDSQDTSQKLPFTDIKTSEKIKKELLKFAEKL
jgi:RNA processing factor Prp31